MNAYDRIYEMILLDDPIEEDFKSALKKAIHPASTLRKALPRSWRRRMVPLRRKLGYDFRNVAATAAFTGAAFLGGTGYTALTKPPEKAPDTVEQPAKINVPEPGDFKQRGLGSAMRARSRPPYRKK